MSEHKMHVAVVDDDDSFARALSRLLRASGFEVVVYRSAEAFLARTPLSSPACMVLDIQLGGISGLELRQRLTSSGSTTPVIFVTAHDEPEVRDQARQVGCAAYFRKPVQGKLLVEAITTAVGKGNIN